MKTSSKVVFWEKKGKDTKAVGKNSSLCSYCIQLWAPQYKTDINLLALL